MKKLTALLLAAALAALAAVPCFAAEAKTVVYTGAGTLDAGTGMDGFAAMAPGVTSSDALTLKNSSDQTVDYYLYLDVVDTLRKGESSGAAYRVSLTCGSSTLYGYDAATGKADGTVVGGDSDGLKSLNKTFGPEKAVWLASLAPGESTKLTLTITPLGDTMDNAYQLSGGLINFRFAAEQRSVTGPTPTAPQTGDTSCVGLGLALTAAMLGLSRWAAKKKKEAGR